MREATFTELRNQAKHYFDRVETGEIVRVLRSGKPIAGIHLIARDLPSWKQRPARSLSTGGASISRQLREERLTEARCTKLRSNLLADLADALVCGADVFVAPMRARAQPRSVSVSGSSRCEPGMSTSAIDPGDVAAIDVTTTSDESIVAGLLRGVPAPRQELS